MSMKMYVSFVALMSVLLAISPPVEASGNKEKLELGDNEERASAPKSLSKGKKKEKPKGEASDEEGEGEEKSSPHLTLDAELWTEILLQAVSGDILQGCKDLAAFKVTHSPFYHIIKSPYFIQRYKKIIERRFPAAMVDLWEEDERYYRQAGTLFSTLKKGEELECQRRFSEARDLYVLTLQENPLLANSRLLISRLMNLIHYPDFDSFPQGNDQFRDLFLEFVRGKVLGAAKSLFGEKKLQGEKFGADKEEILFKLYFLLKTGFEESPRLKEEMGDDTDALEKETEKAKGILEKDLEKEDVKGFDKQDLPLLSIARQLPCWFLDDSLTQILRELYLVRLANMDFLRINGLWVNFIFLITIYAGRLYPHQ